MISAQIDPFITRLSGISIECGMMQVFEHFRSHQMINFITILDSKNRPLGIICEEDLKDFTYGMFGRELINRENVGTFITACPVISSEMSIDEILNFAALNPHPVGVIVTHDSIYEGVILNGSLLQMSEVNRQQTQKRLLQAQKLEAIGTLAGGIAHDFNNILMPILGYAELIAQKAAISDTQILLYINQIITAGQRARDLVAQILAFSRQTENHRIAVHVTPIIKEIVKLLRASIPSTIAIEMSIQTKEDSVWADPTEFHQILMNLCTNAAHAMRPEGGVLSVMVSKHVGYCIGFSEESLSRDREYIRLTVSDTGYGIPRSNFSRIFDPFFTTKKHGEGTGMGLAVVHGIVKSLGGIISVESEKHVCTSFHVYLPLLSFEKINTVEMKQEPIQTIKGNGLHILFVDDEVTIADLAQESLSQYGFKVTVLSNSFEAMEMFKKNPNDFDCVISDQTMPILTGGELARAMLDIRPEISIIICTGFSDTVTPEIAKAIGIAEYVTKPVDFESLARIVVRLLEKEKLIAQR